MKSALFKSILLLPSLFCIIEVVGGLDIVFDEDYFSNRVLPTVGLGGGAGGVETDLRGNEVQDNWDITAHYYGKGVAAQFLKILKLDKEALEAFYQTGKLPHLKILFIGGHCMKSLVGWAAATILSHMGVECHLYVAEEDDENTVYSGAALHSQLLIQTIKANHESLYPNIHFVSVNKYGLNAEYNDQDLADAKCQLKSLIIQKYAYEAAEEDFDDEIDRLEYDLKTLYEQFKKIINLEKLHANQNECLSKLQEMDFSMVVDCCAPGETTQNVEFNIGYIEPLFIMNNIGARVISIDIPSFWNYFKGSKLPDIYKEFNLAVLYPEFIIYVGALKTYILKQGKYERIHNVVIVPHPLEEALDEKCLGSPSNILSVLDVDKMKILGKVDEVAALIPNAKCERLEFQVEKVGIQLDVDALQLDLAWKRALMEAANAAAQAKQYANTAPAEEKADAVQAAAEASDALNAKMQGLTTCGFQTHVSDVTLMLCNMFRPQ